MADATATKHDTSSFGGLSAVVSTILVVMFFVIAGFSLYMQEFGWLVVLFALPLTGQVTGLFFLHHRPREKSTIIGFLRFYLLMMVLCAGGCCLMWAVYLFDKEISISGFLLGWWMVVCLLIITLLMGLVVCMTFAIMCPNMDDQYVPSSWFQKRVHWMIKNEITLLDRLKDGVSQEPFLAFLLFFTTFLGVSYLFGFAFAFHDKSLIRSSAGDGTEVRRGLYMRVPHPVEVADAAKNIQVKQLVRVSFYFGDLKAIPDIETFPDENMADSLAANAQYKKLLWVKRKNQQSISALLRSVIGAESYKGLRIVILGRASDSPVPKSRPPQQPRGRRTVSGRVSAQTVQWDPYPSNYELSEARAYNVKYRIREALMNSEEQYRVESLSRGVIYQEKWPFIQWECLGQSNEAEPPPLVNAVNGDTLPSAGLADVPATDGERMEERPLGEDEMRRVEEVVVLQTSEDASSLQFRYVQADKPKNMDLIDYIYFANYTITTTGYGDIIPLTPWAKFICALANICEVFFLVVFFNALLSLKRDERPITPSAGQVVDFLRSKNFLKGDEWQHAPATAADYAAQPPPPSSGGRQAADSAVAGGGNDSLDV